MAGNEKYIFQKIEGSSEEDESVKALDDISEYEDIQEMLKVLDKSWDKNKFCNILNNALDKALDKSNIAFRKIQKEDGSTDIWLVVKNGKENLQDIKELLKKTSDMIYFDHDGDGEKDVFETRVDMGSGEILQWSELDPNLEEQIERIIKNINDVDELKDSDYSNLLKSLKKHYINQDWNSLAYFWTQLTKNLWRQNGNEAKNKILQIVHKAVDGQQIALKKYADKIKDKSHMQDLVSHVKNKWYKWRSVYRWVDINNLWSAYENDNMASLNNKENQILAEVLFCKLPKEKIDNVLFDKLGENTDWNKVASSEAVERIRLDGPKKSEPETINDPLEFTFNKNINIDWKDIVDKLDLEDEKNNLVPLQKENIVVDNNSNQTIIQIWPPNSNWEVDTKYHYTIDTFETKDYISSQIDDNFEINQQRINTKIEKPSSKDDPLKIDLEPQVDSLDVSDLSKHFSFIKPSDWNNFDIKLDKSISSKTVVKIIPSNRWQNNKKYEYSLDKIQKNNYVVPFLQDSFKIYKKYPGRNYLDSNENIDQNYFGHFYQSGGKEYFNFDDGKQIYYNNDSPVSGSKIGLVASNLHDTEENSELDWAKENEFYQKGMIDLADWSKVFLMMWEKPSEDSPQPPSLDNLNWKNINEIQNKFDDTNMEAWLCRGFGNNWNKIEVQEVGDSKAHETVTVDEVDKGTSDNPIYLQANSNGEYIYEYENNWDYKSINLGKDPLEFNEKNIPNGLFSNFSELYLRLDEFDTDGDEDKDTDTKIRLFKDEGSLKTQKVSNVSDRNNWNMDLDRLSALSGLFKDFNFLENEDSEKEYMQARLNAIDGLGEMDVKFSKDKNDNIYLEKIISKELDYSINIEWMVINLDDSKEIDMTEMTSRVFQCLKLGVRVAQSDDSIEKSVLHNDNKKVYYRSNNKVKVGFQKNKNWKVRVSDIDWRNIKEDKKNNLKDFWKIKKDLEKNDNSDYWLLKGLEPKWNSIESMLWSDTASS